MWSIVFAHYGSTIFGNVEGKKRGLPDFNIPPLGPKRVRYGMSSLLSWSWTYTSRLLLSHTLLRLTRNWWMLLCLTRRRWTHCSRRGGFACLSNTLRASSLAVKKYTLLKASAASLFKVVGDCFYHLGRWSLALLQRVVKDLGALFLAASRLFSERFSRSLAFTNRLSGLRPILLSL